jgi:hypothetical protein
VGALLAFRTGLARTVRYWPVLGLLFALNLAGAALLAALPASGLLGASYRTPFREAADGVDPWLMLETFLSSPVDTALGEAGPGAGTQQILLTGLAVIAAAVPLAWLTSAFLNGGLLLTYAESPERFQWRRFMWGGWHWLGAFLLLELIQGTVVVAAGLPLAVLVIALLLGPLRWLGWIAGLLLAVLALAGLALFEYAGAFMVLRQTRNPLTGLGQSFRRLFQTPQQWIGLYALALLLLLAINLVYYLGLSPAIPLVWWPLLLAVRQVFVAARLWARLVRWAGVVAVIEQKTSGVYDAGGPAEPGLG